MYLLLKMLLDELNHKNFMCVLQGNRGSGKSVALKFLLTRSGGLYESYDLVLVWTTSANSRFFLEFLPPGSVAVGLNDDKLHRIMEAQTDDDDPPRLLMVFDDLCYDRNLCAKHPSIKKIAFEGRHYNISCILTTQLTSTGIGSNIYSNCDFFVFFRFPLQSHRKLLVDNVLSAYMEKDEADLLLKKLPRYSFCFMNLSGASDDLEESCQVFKVPACFV